MTSRHDDLISYLKREQQNINQERDHLRAREEALHDVMNQIESLDRAERIKDAANGPRPVVQKPAPMQATS